MSFSQKSNFNGNLLFPKCFKKENFNYSMDEIRIKLKAGKQTELIYRAKCENDETWKELSERISVCEGYLKNELRKEKRTLRVDIFKKLEKIVGKSYQSQITETLQSNWGKAKGGRNSVFKPMVPKLLLTKPSEELAEFVGIILGDGGIYEKREKGIYQTRVFGHKQDDYDYITNKVFGLFKNLFGVEPSIYTKPNTNAIMASKQSKDLIYTLKHFGLKSGKKVTNGSSIPNWVFENENYLKACIRGLVDTDGSVYPKTKKHRTPSISFYNASPGIRRDFSKALKILGYKVSKWTEKKNSLCQSCSIGSSEEVMKYFQQIGFSNLKHMKRFEKFCKAPIV